MRIAYLDNSSTTPVSNGAAQRALLMMTEGFGNPSSLHGLGLAAEEEMDRARAALAKFFGCEKREITFTSGGTEANNIALFGAAYANRRRGKRIVTTAVEHPSVLNAAKALEQEGFEVVYLPVGPDGVVPLQAVEQAVDDNTILVSMMLVNNETGALQPVAQTAQIIRQKRSHALLHCDAVQAFGKISCNTTALGADIISISGHKLHAPKGVGALSVKKGVRLIPRTYGGGQEKGLRPGTESVPLIAAFGQAVEELGNIAQNYERVAALNEYCRSGLLELGAALNSSGKAFPYVLNFSVPGLRSEVLLHFLESQGVYVSSGSACSKGHKSHVLTAQGCSNQLIDSAIRVSFSRENTKEDAEQLLAGVKQGMAVLRHLNLKR